MQIKYTNLFLIGVLVFWCSGWLVCW